MLVSLIIPAYNAADTIERCLNSIYALSLKLDEFEVIVIDDASTDHTCDVIASYQSQHTNITLLKQPENHRQGAARNRGVKIAKGKYICFVDADDIVMAGIVSAIRLAKEKKVDMVAMHHEWYDEEGNLYFIPKNLSWSHNEIFSGIQMEATHPWWCSGPIGYIYDRDFLQTTQYPFAEDVIYEDADFVMNHLYYARRMIYSEECAYHVLYNSSSTTHAPSYRNVSDFLFLGMRMLALYERIYPDVENTLDVKDKENIRKFAEHALDGACYNLYKSCYRLIKLSSREEIEAFYNRLDAHYDRDVLLADKRLRAYYWNGWTWLCLSHRRIATIIASIVIKAYFVFKRVKKSGRK